MSISKIQLRRGTAAAWTAANPTLDVGETGYETDTKRRKTGDGVTAWTSLPYTFDGTTAAGTYRSMAGRLASLTTPIYMAHRGGGNIAPENTIEAMRQAASLGLKGLESDAHALKGGGLGVMHDSTVDRTTASTGNVVDKTLAEWTAITPDASSWFLATGRYSTGMSVLPTVEDIVREFGGRKLLMIEAKELAAAQPLVDRIVAEGLTSSFIFESSSSTFIAPALAAGIPVALIVSDASTPAATLLGYGVTWVLVQNGAASTAAVQAYRAAGLKVGVYSVSRHVDRDVWLAIGVEMIISDDPLYVQAVPGAAPSSSATDPFASQTYGHGMLASSGGFRGTAIGSDRWGFDAVPSYVNQYVTLGWNYISGDPTAYTQALKVTFDNSVTNGQANYAFSMLTDGLFDVTTKTDGYHVRITVDGTIKLYKDDKTAGTSTQLGSTLSTGAIAAGDTRTLSIAVTGSGITVTLTAGTGGTLTNVGGTITTTDTAYRGRYSHLGRGGVNTQQVSFSAMSRT